MELLRQRAGEIREAQAALREYIEAGREEFLRNRQISDAAKYRLLLAIEACIAICNHLAARIAHKAPTTFAECFEILEEQAIISHALCRKLAEMSRFRNLLVHGYWKVDDEQIHRIIQNDLGDLDDYLQSVQTYLEKKND